MPDGRISPPSVAEALLRRVTPAAMQAGLLGDLEERYRSLSASRGPRAARLWYWAETLRALPGLWLFSLETIQLRRQTVNGNILVREGKWSAALGAFFLLPLALLVIPGVLFSLFGKMVPASLNSIPGVAQTLALVDNPWLVLGGLALGLGINLIAVLRIRVETLEDAWRATVLLKKNAWNLVVLILAAAMATALLAYAIGENLLPLL